DYDFYSSNALNDAKELADIYYKAGYTEAGAFIRAFKIWTGFTPNNFRKGLII
ncbi:MAG: helix-turn-helix domain-containing protein, partial [Pseudomonadales bacterium]|nr:helix-turn-helix domain-containing protein [Pseudomonadales bacterium]